MNYRDFAGFIQKNAIHFKNFKVDIPIYEKSYEFSIVSITSKHIKFIYKFSYYELFISKEGSVEYLLKKIIVDDERAVISNDLVLSQRARNKRNLRGVSFKASVFGSDETFNIKNITQDSVSIEKTVEFMEFDNPVEGSLPHIIQIQLFSLKDLVDLEIKSKENERLQKELSRLERLDSLGDKNTIYTEWALINKALYNKFKLKKTCYPAKIHDKICSFDIDGVGPIAVKLGKTFNVFDIYYSNSDSVEGQIKSRIDEVLGGEYEDIDEFKRKIDYHSYEFDRKILFEIGEGVYEFSMDIFPDEIKLETFVKYNSMINQFKNGKDCLETGLKKYIENFR